MTYIPQYVKSNFSGEEKRNRVELGQAMKETRITLRAKNVLKAELERIAQREGRSVAQVCEAFLQAGCAEYRKKGPNIILRYLSRKSAKKP